MVAQQILVLYVRVRVLVRQQKIQERNFLLDFLLYNIGCLLLEVFTSFYVNVNVCAPKYSQYSNSWVSISVLVICNPSLKIVDSLLKAIVALIRGGELACLLK